VPSLEQRAQAVISRLSAASRYLPMRLEFQTHDGRVLLSAGGLWDRLTDRWATPRELLVLRAQDMTPERFAALCPKHILHIEDSQVEYVGAFAEWLYAFHHDLPRPTALDVLAGKRRGGKTFIMVACVLAAAVACPYHLGADGKRSPFVGWLVVPSFPEQREIHEDFLAVLRARTDEAAQDFVDALDTATQALPASWYQFRPNPNNVYAFAHGASVWLKSANNPDSLKQGRVDVIGINEAQKVDGDSVIHASGNNIDLGGLTILAANPPRKARGAWLLEVKAAWDEGRAIDPEDQMAIVRWFWIDPEKNRRINQPARRKNKILGGMINPKLAAADADNEWNQINDVVIQHWDTSLLIQEVPVLWENVTGEVIHSMRLREYLRHPSGYTSFGGIDFQTYPWMAALRLQAFRDPTRPDPYQPGQGLLCYVVQAELRSDPELGKGTTERQFIVHLHRKGWSPEEMFFIGDASGQWQNAQERKKGGVSAGHKSFDLFRSATRFEEDGKMVDVPPWDMFAPTTIKGEGSKYYDNPPVIETIDEINELLRTRRLFVMASCRHLHDAMKKCEMYHGKAVGAFAHIIDALRYPIHRAQAGMEPKKRAKGGATLIKRGGSVPRRGPGVRFGGG